MLNTYMYEVAVETPGGDLHKSTISFHTTVPWRPEYETTRNRSIALMAAEYVKIGCVIHSIVTLHDGSSIDLDWRKILGQSRGAIDDWSGHRPARLSEEDFQMSNTVPLDVELN